MKERPLSPQQDNALHSPSHSIYALGSNGSGQLGIGHVEDVSSPARVKINLDGAKVKEITAGGNHTLVLLDDGKVFSSGNNEDGRCGHRDGHTCTQMQRVVLSTQFAEHRVRNVAATWSASFFVLDDQQTVLVCGTGEHGELGLGNGTIKSVELQQIILPHAVPSGIMQISACLAHVVVLLANGEVWGWGRGRKGQLGAPGEDVWSPRRVIDLGFAVTDVACGVDFTIASTKTTPVELRVLGLESRDRFAIKASAPRTLQSYQAIFTSWGSVYILFQDGAISAWGRNDRGQLPPADLPSVRAFAAGSEHWVAITSEGQILTAGWGEHGNCGETLDSLGVVKDCFNILSVPGRPVQVFAGCATSFIVVEIQGSRWSRDV